jgi:hypothetical protein
MRTPFKTTFGLPPARPLTGFAIFKVGVAPDAIADEP